MGVLVDGSLAGACSACRSQKRPGAEERLSGLDRRLERPSRGLFLNRRPPTRYSRASPDIWTEAKTQHTGRRPQPCRCALERPEQALGGAVRNLTNDDMPDAPVGSAGPLRRRETAGPLPSVPVAVRGQAVVDSRWGPCGRDASGAPTGAAAPGIQVRGRPHHRPPRTGARAPAAQVVPQGHRAHRRRHPGPGPRPPGGRAVQALPVLHRRSHRHRRRPPALAAVGRSLPSHRDDRGGWEPSGAKNTVGRTTEMVDSRYRAPAWSSLTAANAARPVSRTGKRTTAARAARPARDERAFARDLVSRRRNTFGVSLGTSERQSRAAGVVQNSSAAVGPVAVASNTPPPHRGMEAATSLAFTLVSLCGAG